MAYLSLIETDEALVPILRGASSKDLETLVQYIYNAFSEQLSSVPSFKRENPRAKEKIFQGDHRIYADEIAAEIQKFGGNSISNIFRGGKGVPYSEILKDVADHLRVKYDKKDQVEIIEQKIQIKLLDKAYSKLSDSDKRKLLGSDPNSTS